MNMPESPDCKHAVVDSCPVVSFTRNETAYRCRACLRMWEYCDGELKPMPNAVHVTADDLRGLFAQ